MTSEFSILLAELKEQILYLQELGVENFDVELPELEDKLQNIADRPIQNPKSGNSFCAARFAESTQTGAENFRNGSAAAPEHS